MPLSECKKLYQAHYRMPLSGCKNLYQAHYCMPLSGCKNLYQAHYCMPLSGCKKLCQARKFHTGYISNQIVKIKFQENVRLEMILVLI